MKRIGILTAGGDTPALNATIHGAVVRANQLRIEIFGLIKGFNCLFNPRVPHVHLNPLFQEIPELDPTKGGTLIGSSRDYVDPDKKDELDLIASRLAKLGIEGLIAIGGDGTLNGLQPLAERLPTVLAPKTIDNDLGPELPERARRMGARQGRRRQARLPLQAHGVERRLRSQSDRQLRHARLRHGGVRLRAGRRAHPHHRREPSPHRHHRGDGPALRLHRARHRLRAAGHHPGSRASARHRAARRAGQAPLRPAEERRHRLRRGHRRRAGRRARRGIDVHRSGRQRRAERRGGGAAREADRSCSATATSSATAAAARPAKRSSPEKSATRSAAGGRFSSTASTRRSSARRPSICSSKGATTPCPSCNTTPTRAFTSKATTRTAFATAGA